MCFLLNVLVKCFLCSCPSFLAADFHSLLLQISKQQLQTVKDRFQAFLNGETQIVADEAFMNAVQSYYEVFLKSDRVARMVQSGGCSANDSREVFKKHIEKRVRSLPEIDGLSKETVLSSWMAKFDAIYRGEEDPRKQQARMTASAASELILSKEQLYEMFQNILGIKKFEHQLLYNACQFFEKCHTDHMLTVEPPTAPSYFLQSQCLCRVGSVEPVSVPNGQCEARVCAQWAV
ncbi:hypothetical protein NN561_007633 [Cricetulus griseus]